MKVRIILIYLFFCTLMSFSETYCNSLRKPPDSHSKIKFIANRNQWEKPVLFKAELPFGAVFLEKASFTYLITDPLEIGKCHHPDSCGNHQKITDTENHLIKCHAINMRFNGANENAEVVGKNKFPEYYNYFIGNDQQKWASEVPLFDEIIYCNLYPGINLNVGSKSQNLKYEYCLSPDTDPDLINISYEGASSLNLYNGKLIISNSVNDIIEQKPYAYQIINGDTITVACKYQLQNGHVTFHFPQGYKKDLPLVIDPVVMASTYAGTLAAVTYGHTATYDQDGNIYTGGRSFGQGYPTTIGSFMTMFGGGTNDVVISKFNPTGSALIWASYLGGSLNDFAHSLIVNSKNELYVYGSTNSLNFPVKSNSFQIQNKGDFDIFISHFNAAGSALIGSTYVGGTQVDGQNQIAHNYGDLYRGEIILDSAENPMVASFTYSADFPVTAGTFGQTMNGMQDAVVFKLDSNLTTMVNSTFLGGNSLDAAYGIKINSLNEVIVGGGTGSIDFPVTPACLNANFMGPFYDGFITRFSPDLSAILASTYYGTTSFDEVFFVELDSEDNIYVYGQTEGYLPITPGCYGNIACTQFITKLPTKLDSIIYQTVFGNIGITNSISPTAFLVDICENVYAAGWGSTDNFPVSPNAVQSTTDGSDFYLIVLNKDAISLLYATYYGSPNAWEHVDGGTSRFDKKGIVYEAVCEGSQNFPTTPGAYMSTSNVPWDLAVFKIDFQLTGPKAIIGVNPGITGCAPFQVSFTNNSANAVSYIWDFGDGSPTSNLTVPNHTYSIPGIYQVQCFAIDSSACLISDSATLTLTVNGGFSTFLGNDSTLCISDSITLNAGVSGGSYIWNTGDTTQNINVITSGIYWVNIEKDNCFAADTIQLTLIPIPAVELGLDKFLCKGDSLTLSSGHPSLSHLWSTGATSPEIQLNDSGLYYVSVDSLGCIGSDSIFVHMHSLISNLPPDTLVCPNDTIFLDPGMNGCLYLWSTGDTTRVLNIIYPGNYWVQIHDTLCQIADTIIVKQPGLLNLPEMLDLCGKANVNITSNIEADNYQWSSGESSAAIEITKAGTYILEVIQGQCTQRDTTVVTGESGLSTIEFPNVFTPNNDGKNDYFLGSGASITSLEMRIFNRWGKLLFKTNEINGSWDGKYNDNFVPEGVYFYLVRYTTICSGNSWFEKSGSLTVFR